MTPLGPFAVAATPSQIDAFRAATGLPPGAAVPLTFPMRWLAADAVRTALTSLAADADFVPVHESQSFDYAAPLASGTEYALNLLVRREVAPDRLVVEGTVEGTDGTPVARLETILRLFSTTAVAA